MAIIVDNNETMAVCLPQDDCSMKIGQFFNLCVIVTKEGSKVFCLPSSALKRKIFLIFPAATDFVAEKGWK